MRIAQVAPLWERVPPPAYGGTELVVAHLANELTRRGHDVTLFATADSKTLAKLEPGAPQPMRLAGVTPVEYQLYDLMQLTRVVQQADQFDVIHFHVDASALPYGNLLKTPVVHTIHGVLTPTAAELFAQNRHQNFVSISDSQRRNDLGLNYVATVYNGIDPATYEFHPQPDEPPYLAFFGRISPEKGPHLAIELAKRTGWRLIMAGKVDRADQAFYESEVKPLIDGKQIVYVGEANHAQKSEIMGRAVATLCLLTWEEPFGLVMPESMVCGTPVIAMARGSAPELIVHGKTGFLCHSMDECVAALAQIETIDRKACREHVEQNFSHIRMVEGYEAVYYQLMEKRFAQNGKLQRSKPTSEPVI
ncbi:glycosyltransferase family 4 protein [Leptolyngbya sp. 7M]|uniref:glycosyltransferase family 4 protein n=1 Tax=Leptolyngbya sp. 7M TaxID=2812896 RepID=UPI001B8D2621|nr:glycosyltransferase family 4 protein [Leptolyngbya sp. 7M]QYO62908.1 glycosyltransferase family 4 protein [Leptolyngbya sp. 7M]